MPPKHGWGGPSMARVSRDERFCLHASGEVVVTVEDGMCCGDCGTPMVFVSRRYLESVAEHLAQARRDLADCRKGITRRAGE